MIAMGASSNEWEMDITLLTCRVKFPDIVGHIQPIKEFILSEDNVQVSTNYTHCTQLPRYFRKHTLEMLPTYNVQTDFHAHTSELPLTLITCMYANMARSNFR